MIILDGKAVALARRHKLSQSIKQFKSANGLTPGLAVVVVGDDPASQVYVNNKAKTCKELGMESWVHALKADSKEAKVKELILSLNKDPKVTGILVQLPLPKHLNSSTILALVDPKKDPDCLTAENVGLFHLGKPRSQPCTPSGVIEILKHYKISISGKSALVIGRSHIVGQPMAQLLLNNDATVTIAHSKTKNLMDLVKTSDIVVVAAGKPEFLKIADFKKDAVIIDVGIHRSSVGGTTKLVGDVKRDEKVEANHSGSITPVPGGVGPMTIQMLMENTFNLAQSDS
jgi:methylenetetrahydrofolate dehydrogenase (NADP+)/methenyltetrahydrofolate cyclohydrolase